METFAAKVTAVGHCFELITVKGYTKAVALG